MGIVFLVCKQRTYREGDIDEWNRVGIAVRHLVEALLSGGILLVRFATVTHYPSPFMIILNGITGLIIFTFREGIAGAGSTAPELSSEDRKYRRRPSSNCGQRNAPGENSKYNLVNCGE